MPRDKGWKAMKVESGRLGRVTSELKDVRGPAKGQGVPGRGNSKCKSPEAGAAIRPVWLEQSERGGEEREWGEVRGVEPRLGGLWR